MVVGVVVVVGVGVSWCELICSPSYRISASSLGSPFDTDNNSSAPDRWLFDFV